MTTRRAVGLVCLLGGLIALACESSTSGADEAFGPTTGGAGGAGTGGAGPTGLNVDATCAACFAKNCDAPVDACAASTVCSSVIGCVQGCGLELTCAGACYRAPGVDTPSLELAEPVLTCVADSCSSDCRSSFEGDAGSGGNGGGLDPACQACLDQNGCYDAAARCAANVACGAILKCVEPCADEACVNACFQANPEGEADFKSSLACSATCAPSCVGGSSGSGGSSGACVDKSRTCLSQTELQLCNDGTPQVLNCPDTCKADGYDRFVGCGSGSTGAATCLCENCSAGGDVCACQAPQFPTGYACGANLSFKADPARLYFCNNEVTAGSVLCAAGCDANALGEADFCFGSEADPCINSPFDSDSCGANLFPGANPNVLYTCQGQQTVSSITCPNGCFAAPFGEADRCNLVEMLGAKAASGRHPYSISPTLLRARASNPCLPVGGAAVGAQGLGLGRRGAAGELFELDPEGRQDASGVRGSV